MLVIAQSNAGLANTLLQPDRRYNDSFEFSNISMITKKLLGVSIEHKRLATLIAPHTLGARQVKTPSSFIQA